MVRRTNLWEYLEPPYNKSMDDADAKRLNNIYYMAVCDAQRCDVWLTHIRTIAQFCQHAGVKNLSDCPLENIKALELILSMNTRVQESAFDECSFNNSSFSTISEPGMLMDDWDIIDREEVECEILFDTGKAVAGWEDNLDLEAPTVIEDIASIRNGTTTHS